MSTVLEAEIRAQAVDITDTTLTVHLEDGRSLTVPLVWYPRLAYGTPSEREAVEIIGGGIGLHWPALDEDLSVRGLLEGRKTRESPEHFARWREALQARRQTPNPEPWGDVLPMPEGLDAE